MNIRISKFSILTLLAFWLSAPAALAVPDGQASVWANCNIPNPTASVDPAPLPQTLSHISTTQPDVWPDRGCPYSFHASRAPAGKQKSLDSACNNTVSERKPETHGGVSLRTLPHGRIM